MPKKKVRSCIDAGLPSSTSPTPGWRTVIVIVIAASVGLLYVPALIIMGAPAEVIVVVSPVIVPLVVGVILRLVMPSRRPDPAVGVAGA